MAKTSHEDKNCKKEKITPWSVELLEGGFPCNDVLCHCLLQIPVPVEFSALPKWFPEPSHWTVFTASPEHLCFCPHSCTHSISHSLSGHIFLPWVWRLFLSYLVCTAELTGRHGVMNLLCDHSLSWRKDARLSLSTINFHQLHNVQDLHNNTTITWCKQLTYISKTYASILTFSHHPVFHRRTEAQKI